MSSWGSFLLYDPQDLEKFYSNDNAFSELPSVWGELQEESFADLARVREILDLIPPREADFIDLYFFKRVRQTCIAEMFNVSQPTICYRLRRGAARIKFLLDLNPYTTDFLEKEIRRVLSDPTDVSIMMGMLKTTCQSDVARDLGVTQGFVRHRFLRSIELLEKTEEFSKYAEVFNKVRKNVNVLKNNNRASWSDTIIYSLG